MTTAALVTGSGRGLGEKLALAFSSAGHNIILHGRNLDNLKSVQNKINGKSRIVHGDIRSSETLDELSSVSHEWDLSVLINNAGMPSLGLSFSEVNEYQIESMIYTNLISPIRLIHKMYAILKKNKGTIVNINSICGSEPKKNRTLYCASRWAMRGFDASLRLECETEGIKLIGIYPSRIKTRPEFTEGLDPETVVSKVMELYTQGKSTFCKMDDRPISSRSEENINYG